LVDHHDLGLVILAGNILLQTMTEGNHSQVKVLVNPEAEQEAVVSVVQVLLEAAASAAQAEAVHEAVALVKLAAANQEAIQEADSVEALLEVVVSVVQVLLEAEQEAVALAEKEEAIFQNQTHVDQKAEHQISVLLAKPNTFYY
jgi:hypothetical protein